MTIICGGDVKSLEHQAGTLQVRVFAVYALQHNLADQGIVLLRDLVRPAQESKQAAHLQMFGALKQTDKDLQVSTE